jgi:DNA-binding CsgD family transcriptional regulator
MLIGRSEELARLDAILDRVRGGMSGCIVLRGEAGIGKTALLDETEDAAREFLVLRLEGIESEMQLAYAALHRLLRPYLAYLRVLPEPQRDALESAFGLASAGPPDRFMVSLAALSLLGEVAKRNALLVIVDDAQWIDGESVAALVFVARRLDADRIALVFAARESLEFGAAFQGIDELWIEGLDSESARDLVAASVTGPVSYRVAERIVSATRGNPLALRELSGELTAEHLMEQSPLPDPLPVGDLIEARFLRQVRLLPPETQTMLLLAAADPVGDPHSLYRAGETLGLPAAIIEPAVDDGLLAMDPRVEFRHPLVRAAVYGGAPIAERRRVHLALASIMDVEHEPDRKALHMALAAAIPDEEVAIALERSAAKARSRGGYVAESSFLARSASLSPDPQRRAGRLLLAAQAAFVAGNANHSEALLGEARPELTDPVQKAQAQLLDGRLRHWLGQTHLAPALLLDAARAFRGLEPELSRHSLLDAFVSYVATGKFADGITEIDIAATALKSLESQTDIASPPDILLRGVAMRCVGEYDVAVPFMREALQAYEALSFEEINRWTHLGTIIAYELWDEDACRRNMERLEKAARAQGALPSLQIALIGLAVDQARQGRLADARDRYAELKDVTMAIGDHVEFFALFEVDLLCWQGHQQARLIASHLIDYASAFGAASLVERARLSLTILELAEGRYEEALAAAQAVVAGNLLGWGCQALPLTVEAAIRCGRRDAAMDAMAILSERAAASGTPWCLGLLARCRALLADDASAAELYEEALSQLGQTVWVTEVARTHLLYGEWLRRQKRRTDAREQLRRSFDIFLSMGAGPFAERARLELLATGEQARARNITSSYDLTSRELQIARLAAQRITSREIAGQLFISTSTVDYHLRKVFQKLGVSSRRELAPIILEDESRLA